MSAHGPGLGRALGWALWRLLELFVTAALTAAGALWLLRAAPGVPSLSPDDPASLRLPEAWRPGQPYLQQYGRWLWAALHGDLGVSLVDGRPVAAVLADALPGTLLLGSVALGLALGVGVRLGVARAVPGSPWLARAAAALPVLQAVPGFALALGLIALFGAWLPIQGFGSAAALTGPGWLWDRLLHLLLPALALSVPLWAPVAAQVEGSLGLVAGAGWVRAARARGLREAAVVRGMLRASLAATLARAGAWLPGLLGGSVVIETCFGLPGLGRAGARAAALRDLPVLLGVALVATALTQLGQLLAEVVSARLDPRLERP